MFFLNSTTLSKLLSTDEGFKRFSAIFLFTQVTQLSTGSEILDEGGINVMLVVRESFNALNGK